VGVTPLAEAREIYRFYHALEDETIALRGVDLAVRGGELVAVVGPSGSGKSSLLACLAGIDDPDGGSVYLEGRRISRRPLRERARLRRGTVGLVMRGENLLEPLTVAQNVDVAARLNHARGDRVTALLDALALRHRANARPSTLSGGEAARAALAVALAGSPRLLIADEPTAALGAGDEARVIALLRETVARGAGVVVATHAETVASAAGRVVELRDGRVVSHG
jgi:putative ABC transport system ATP-binding protein